MKKNGYTMSEVMLMLALIAVIAAILLPLINSNLPNKNKMLYKKSYHEAERVIADLINDSRFYPDEEGFAYGNDYEMNGSNVSAKGVIVDGVEYVGANKFCMAFVSKVSILGSIKEGCTTTFDSTPSFTTTNGTDWYIQNWAPKLKVTGDNKVVSENPVTIILIDTNGDDRPNCRASSYRDSLDNAPKSKYFNPDTAKVVDDKCKKPDRFQFNVAYNGRITVSGEVEQGYLKNTKINK